MSEVTSVVEQEQQQQENVGGSSNTELRCNDCNVSFNSDKSLEVHLHYHKDNLLSQWSSQAQQHESNNNNSKAGNHNRHVKSDNVTAPADPREQSSIPSSQDPTSSQQQQQQQQPRQPQQQHQQRADQAYNHFLTPISYSETNYNILQNMSHVQNISMATCQSYSPSHEDIQNNGGCNSGGAGSGGYHPRFHPYQTQHFPPERVTNSSTSPQTPPLQCDKCGAIYDDATLLSEHMRTSHSDSPTAYPSAPQYQQLGGSPQHQEQQQQQSQQQLHTSPPQSNHPHQQSGYDYNSGQTSKLEMKQDPEEQTEILDLDSHKVQTHRYEEEIMRMQQQQQHQQDFIHIHQHQVLQQQSQPRLGTHSVSSMLGWPPVGQTHEYPGMPAMAPMDNIAPMSDQNQFMRSQHMPVVETPVHTVSPIITNAQQISSHQMPTALMQQPSKSSLSNQSWKSNEARRPKTYNCTACNKWFTSSGHLKRHYNTTLHKNAVKQSNMPDPANMPISAHHHPGRDNIGHSTSGRGGGSSERSPDLTSSASPPNSMAGPSGEATGGLLHTPSTLYNSNSNSNGSNSNDSSVAMGLAQPGPASMVHLVSGIACLNSQQQSPMARHHQQQMDSPSHQVALQQQQQQQQQAQLLPVHLPMNSPGQLQVHHSMNSPISPMLPPSASHITSPSQMGSSPHNVHMNSSIISGTIHPAMVSPTAMGGTTMPHQPYPNGMPPHVTNTTNTGLLGSTNNILVTIGNEQNEQQHQQQRQQQSQEDMLPAFGTFGNHQRSLPSYILGLPSYVESQPQAVNVGGPTSEDTPQKSFDSSGSNFDVYSSPPSYDVMHVDSSAMQTNTEGMITKQYEIQNQQSYPSRHFPKEKYYESNNNNVVRAKEDLNLNVDSDVKITKRRKAEILKEQYVCADPDDIDSDVTDSDGSKKTPYRCQECDKNFNKSCYLTQHNKSFHSGVKPFKCIQCGKRFPTETQHGEHLQKHAGEKPHKCEKCPKQFNHKTDLRRHFCLHTGEKPFSCNACGKGFIRKDHMKKHYETHKKKFNGRQKENVRARLLARDPEGMSSR